MHNEQGPEGARLEPEWFSSLLGLLELLGDLFGRPEIDLRYDLGFTSDPLDLADIIVGSSFFYFFVRCAIPPLYRWGLTCQAQNIVVYEE